MGLARYALADFVAFGEAARLRGAAAVFFACDACGLAEEEEAGAGLLADALAVFGSAAGFGSVLVSTCSGSSTIPCSTTTGSSVASPAHVLGSTTVLPRSAIPS